MRRRTRIATSAAFGVLAALLAAGGMESVRADAQRQRSELLERYGGEVASLVVARRELSAGTVVGEGDIEQRDWLSDLAPEGAFTSTSEVVGARLTSAVAKGAPLTEVDTAQTEGALEVPEGRVAVTVRLSDRAGAPAEVANGARVLVYEARDSSVQLLCDDAVALVASAGGTSAAGDRTLTLAVSPDDVASVLAASGAGSLRVALPADDVEGDASGGTAAPSSVAAQTDGDAADGAAGEMGGEA